jgi:hypothetical protein
MKYLIASVFALFAATVPVQKAEASITVGFCVNIPGKAACVNISSPQNGATYTGTSVNLSAVTTPTNVGLMSATVDGKQVIAPATASQLVQTLSGLSYGSHVLNVYFQGSLAGSVSFTLIKSGNGGSCSNGCGCPGYPRCTY